MRENEPHWWQSGVIYQIYPRSFMDYNDDGTGDLAGIRSRLDYLRWLGVDAIWLSPIYPSPMADFGYDVANYTDIDPLFGSLDDFDRLLDEAHSRNLRVILDLVPNHTSSEHPWFVESRASRDNPRRDWYIWRDPAPGGGVPNNWQTLFGGDAWTFDDHTGQYYLHLFHTKQPDLNWRNADTRQAMFDVMRFWLARGVDGFRVDVMWLTVKDSDFRDNPMNPVWRQGDAPIERQIMVHTADLPEAHDIARQMRAVVDEYPDKVLIGEIFLPVPKLMTWYGAMGDEAHLPFNFQLITLPWRPEVIREAVKHYEASLPPGGWPNWVLGNHDHPRIASRTSRAQARVAQMLLLTLRGTPTCYYGDELGMRDVDIPHEQALDPMEFLSPGHGRDPARTPMQWNAGPNAGFTRGTPWLPVAVDYPSINVEVEQADSRSMLTLTHRLLELRRAMPALAIGGYSSIVIAAPEPIAYLRESAGRRVLIVLNFGATDLELDLSSVGTHGTILLSSFLDRDGTVVLSGLALRGDEGLLIALE